MNESNKKQQYLLARMDAYPRHPPPRSPGGVLRFTHKSESSVMDFYLNKLLLVLLEINVFRYSD